MSYAAAIHMLLRCTYCTTSRLMANAESHYEGDINQIQRRADNLLQMLEVRAQKAGWTREPYTDTNTEWRCKKCTALLAAKETGR